MVGQKRIISLLFFLLVFFGLASCINPAQQNSNTAPWAVTGPTGLTLLTASGGESMSFELIITNDAGGLVTNPGPFDADGDIVVFSEALEDITFREVGGVQVLPVVGITESGVFSISANTDLVGLTAVFSVSVSDGKISTPYDGIDNISIFFN